jgi:hypothetical protein
VQSPSSSCCRSNAGSCASRPQFGGVAYLAPASHKFVGIVVGIIVSIPTAKAGIPMAYLLSSNPAAPASRQ